MDRQQTGPSFQSVAIKLKFCHLKYFQIPTSDPSATSPNDTTKSDENIVGILKNSSTASLTNGPEKVNGDVDSRDAVPSSPNVNGVVRRNSSTPSLRQFVNSASPLIEEESDEEEKEQSSSEENDDEGLSENPVSDG